MSITDLIAVLSFGLTCLVLHGFLRDLIFDVDKERYLINEKKYSSFLEPNPILFATLIVLLYPSSLPVLVLCFA